MKETAKKLVEKRGPEALREVAKVHFRTAHEIVGALVRSLVAQGRAFQSLTLDEWRRASDRFEADSLGRVTPRMSVDAKRTPQSTAPGAVAAALADVQGWVDHVAG